MRLIAASILILCPLVASDENIPLPERARQYLIDLIRLDTTNPPGNETRVAEYLKQVADAHGIPNELLGADPKRLNFVARLRGTGRARPLLMMAHSDVVPADRSRWTVDPFRGDVHGGAIYGRGAIDDKSLLAAELAVMVEMRRRNIRLNRDVILLSEADEEAGSSGIHWLIANAYPKIDAEWALNEGGYILETRSGRVFNIQTAEKIPTRVVLVARGTAGHGSLPLPDNAIVHLSRAILRLATADQPVRLNATTRRYLRDLSRLDDFSWLRLLIPKLENPSTASAAAKQIRARDPEIDAMLHTTVSPTILRAGQKINVIPNVAEAQLDVRRLPNETRDEVLLRFRQLVNDPAVDVEPAPGQQMPATEPSSLTTSLYKAIEHTFTQVHPEDQVLPYMSRGATDGSFLRARGMNVYGIPIFAKEPGESRAHGNDERISTKTLEDGVELLWQIVMDVAGRE
jgi:acetylornithine deacetylase/succinyl-diaminopimelate desuccinylase-like protein